MPSKWKPSKINHHNEVMQGAGFFVSYVNTTLSPIKAIPAFRSDSEDGIETAIKKDDRCGYLVLNGDHREGLAEVIDKGFDAVFGYYMAHRDSASSWSQEYDYNIEETVNA